MDTQCASYTYDPKGSCAYASPQCTTSGCPKVCTAANIGQGAYQGRYQGWIGFRAKVTQAGSGGTPQQVWVEYGADQTVTLGSAEFGGQAGDPLFLPGAPKPIKVPDGNYQTVSGDRARALIQTYQALANQTMKLDDGGVTNIYQLVSRSNYLTGQYAFTNGGIISSPPCPTGQPSVSCAPQLDPTTTQVLIRSPPALVFPAALVVQEYPFQPAGASVAANIQSILVNADNGSIVMQSLGHISPLYDYFAAKPQGQSFWTCPGAPAAQGQPDNALQAGALQTQVTVNVANAGQSTYTVDNTTQRFLNCDSDSIQKLLGPVPGVTVDSATRWQAPFSDAPKTDGLGHYALDYPYQAGFSLPDTVYFQFKYTPFDPRIQAGLEYFNRVQTYSGAEDVTLQTPALGDSTGGIPQVMFGGGYETDGDLSGVPGDMGAPPILATIPPVRSINLPFDVAVLVGGVHVQNAVPLDDPKITMGDTEVDPNTVIPIDETIPASGDPTKPGVTKYAYYRPTFAQSLPIPPPADTTPVPNPGGSASATPITGPPPTLQQPDLRHHGLLKQIGRADLYNTDLYVYSDTGERIFQRSGLLPQEFEGVTCVDNVGCTQAAGQYDARFNFQTQISISNVAIGAQVRIILINRATGYIGTMWANINRQGAFPEIDIDPGHPIVMGPPNLKVHVERNREDNKILPIGFEGDGLVKDQYIQVLTEWYDADGTSLPPDLPGYTGRLARVDANNKLVPANGAPPGTPSQTPANGSSVGGDTSSGSEGVNNNISTFVIRPGTKTEVLRLPDPAKLLDHFYVHIQGTRSTELANGQSPTFDETSGGSAGSADAPVLMSRPAHYVPFRVAVYDTNAASATQDCNCDPLHPTNYHWAYRPEMAFQLIDLHQLTWQDGNATVNLLDPKRRPGDLGTGTDGGAVSLIYSIIASAVPGLDPLGPPQEIVIVIGDTEIRLQVSVDPKTGAVYIVGLDPSILASLTPDEISAMRIYLESDKGNPLWEFNEFNKIKVVLQKEAGPLLPGQSVTVLAIPDPPTMHVNWSVRPEKDDSPVQVTDESADDTSSDPFEDHLHVVRIDPSSGAGTFVVSASDAQNGVFWGEARLEVGDAPETFAGVDIEIPLGKTVGGGSAGTLAIQQFGQPDKYLASPARLHLSTGSSQVTATVDDFGHVRHVTAAQVFVDVEPVTKCDYTIKVYAIGDVVVGTGDACAPASAIPKDVWRITNPAGCPNGTASDFSALHVTEDVDDTTFVRDYTYKDGTWTLDEGGGLRQTTTAEVQVNPNKRTITQTITGEDGIDSMVVTTYEKLFVLPNEPAVPVDELTGEPAIVDAATQKADPTQREVITQEDKYTGPGTYLTTTWAYYTDSSANGYQKVKIRKNPDGSIIGYEWDDKGRVIAEHRMWLDQGDGTGGGRDIAYDYKPIGADSRPPSKLDEPRTITETIQGQTLAITQRTFTKSHDDATGQDTLLETTDVVIPNGSSPRTLHSEREFGDIGNAVRPSGLLDGRLIRDRTSDGQETRFSYVHEVTTDEVTATMDHYCLTSGSPQQTGSDTEVEDKFGNVESRVASVVSTGGGVIPVVTETNHIGDNNHIVAVDVGGVTMKKADWGWRLLNSETDDRGMTTIYTLDALGRRKFASAEGPGGTVTSTYTYDGVDRVIDMKVDGAGVEQETLRHYDWTGRILSFTPAGGGTTTTEYAGGQTGDQVQLPLTQTVFFPASQAGQPTETTTLYPDGQVASVDEGSPPAALSRYLTYNILGDGTQQVTEHLGSNDSPLTRTTSYDGAGKAYHVERPGHDDSGASVVEKVDITYDSYGRISKQTESGRGPTIYKYDAMGQISAVGTDVNGDGDLTQGNDRYVEFANSYVSDGTKVWEQRIETVYDDGSTTPNGGGSNGSGTVIATRKERVDQTRDGVRSEIQVIDTQGNTKSTVMTVSGTTAMEVVTYPDQTQEVTMFDHGAKTSFKSRSNLTVTYSDIDGLGRPHTINDPQTGQIVLDYDPNGEIHSRTDANSRTETYTYEPGTRRILSISHPMGTQTNFDYDLWGHQIHKYGPGEVEVFSHYDPVYGWLDQVSSVGDGGLQMTQIGHETSTGLVNTVTDPAGKMVTYGYGAGGRVVSRSWARSGGTPDVTYDYYPGTGDLKDITYTNPGTPNVTFAYDILGLRKSVTDGLGMRTFSYTSDFQVMDETVPRGSGNVIIHHDYEPSGSSTIAGRLAGISIPSAAGSGKDYSVNYHFESDTARLSGLDYQVSAAGPTSDTVTYQYQNNTDLLQKMTLASGQTSGFKYVATFSYMPNRSLVQTLDNTVNISLPKQPPQFTVSHYDHDYDDLDRMSFYSRSSGTAFAQLGPTVDAYAYDGTSALSSGTTYPGAPPQGSGIAVPGRTRTYSYDPAGNRKNTVEGQDGSANTVAWSYTPNNLNQYAQRIAGQQTEQFVYDVDGNLTSGPSDGVPMTYTYDDENRLTSVQPSTSTGDNRVDFAYDYMDRRVQKIEYSRSNGSGWKATATTLFFYNGEDLIREERTDNTTGKVTIRHFVWGPARAGGLLASVQDNTSRVYVHDATGSVAQVLDPSTGSTTAQYEYDAFGNTVSSAGSEADTQPFRWNAKYFDAVSATYSFGTIDYRPALGRWMSRGRDANPYRFAENSPPNVDEPFVAPSLVDGLTALLDVGRSFMGPGESMLAASHKYAADERHQIEDASRQAFMETVHGRTVVQAVRAGLIKFARGSVIGAVGVAAAAVVLAIVAPEALVAIGAFMASTAGAVTTFAAGTALAGMQGYHTYSDYQQGNITFDVAVEQGTELGSSIVIPFAFGKAGKLLSGVLRAAAEEAEIDALAIREAGGWEKAELELERAEGDAIGVTREEECAGGVCVTGNCFVAGTLVETATGRQPIETLRVGDRVTTSDDTGSEATTVDPATWRDLRLQMPNPDGSPDVIDIEVLRPLSWVAEVGATPGEWISFELPEMGLEGPARVESVSAVPPLKSGSGRVVRATVTHLNTEVHVLKFREVPDVLEPTATHPLYSIDRQGWVAAADLKENERLASESGPLTILSNKPKGAIERVYNIEVETKHDYLVGKHGVLSHNESLCAKRLREAYLGRTPGKWSKTGREVLLRMYQEGKLEVDPVTGEAMFEASDGEWYPLEEGDMAHYPTDAVRWWNKTGRKFGKKSREGRTWMLDSKNYVIDHQSINRAEGAALRIRYLPPLK